MKWKENVSELISFVWKTSEMETSHCWLPKITCSQVEAENRCNYPTMKRALFVGRKNQPKCWLIQQFRRCLVRRNGSKKRKVCEEHWLTPQNGMCHACNWRLLSMRIRCHCPTMEWACFAPRSTLHCRLYHSQLSNCLGARNLIWKTRWENRRKLIKFERENGKIPDRRDSKRLCLSKVESYLELAIIEIYDRCLFV